MNNSTIKLVVFQAAVTFAASDPPDDSNTWQTILDAIKEAIEGGFSGIVENIFGRLGDEINRIVLEFFQTQIANIYNWLSGIVLTFSNDVFSNPTIRTWFSMISLLAKLCFFVGLTLYVANACIKMSTGRRLMMIMDLKTYALYLAFGWFGVDGAVLMFREVSAFLTTHLITKSTPSIASEVMIELMAVGDLAAVEVLMFVVIIICFVTFLISVMKRIGYIFALISVIPVYMLAFTKGYASGFFSWLRMFASCTITFFLQYVIFYLGINLLISNSFILAVLFFISVPVVPKVLAQFGSGITSMGDILSDVTSTAKQGVSMAKTAMTGV